MQSRSTGPPSRPLSWNCRPPETTCPPGYIEHDQVEIANAARFNARAYHLPGPLALPRDFILRRLGGEGMLDHYAWLYGWTPDGG